MKTTNLVLFEANGKVEGVSPTVRQCGIKSLGLKAIEAYLLSKKFSVEIIMQDEMTIEKLIKKIISLRPNIVGATATTCEIPITAEIMKKLKAHDPGIITAIGGYHISSCPETLDPKYASKHGVDPSGIDLAVLGEGEFTLAEIAEKVKTHKLNELHNVDGIAFYENGKLVKTCPRGRIKNLDVMPKTNWDDKELSANKFDGMMPRLAGRVAAVISERGCMFNCSFCSTKSTYGSYVATRSIPDLVDEVEFLVKERNVTMFIDYAPTANRDHERIFAFCKEVRKRGLAKKFSWYALWRLQSPSGKLMIAEDIVADMAETLYGFKIGMGVESFSEADEGFLGKINSPKNIAQVSKWFDKHGALLRGFYMVTPEINHSSIENCKITRGVSYFDDLRITHLTPFPGTKMATKIKGCLLTEQWSNFNCEQPVIRPLHLKLETIIRVQKSILQNFLDNSYRQKRITKKILAHPELSACFKDYNQKMKAFGFTIKN